MPNARATTWSTSIVVSGAIPCLIATIAVAQVLPPGDEPLLQQATLGAGVSDIEESRLDLEVRNTYTIASADLDDDGDEDLIYGYFYLFNPPLHQGQAPYTPVQGSGGIAVLANQTSSPLTADTGKLNDGAPLQDLPGSQAPTPPASAGVSHYSNVPGGFQDATSVDWNGLPPPSVRTILVTYINDDDVPDLVIAAGVGVDPIDVASFWSEDHQHIAQNRILIQQTETGENGPVGTLHFVDETYGANGVPGDEDDRLAPDAANSCGVDGADLDGDMFDDLIFGMYGPNFTGAPNKFLSNDGTGRFTVQPDPFGGRAGATADIALEDVDGDMDIDIVVANANPHRAPVVDPVTYADTLPEEVMAARRNELWLNNGHANFTFVALPDPELALAAPAPPLVTEPYSDPGFGHDTRKVTVLDVDRDGDKDLLFVNNGWGAGFARRPDGRSAFYMGSLVKTLPGQQSQLLINMGGTQQANVPGAAMNVFADVSEYALPHGRHINAILEDPSTSPVCPGQALCVEDGGWRPLLDMVPADLGQPADLEIDIGELDAPVETVSLPNTDEYPDLYVTAGPKAFNEVWINSGQWEWIAPQTEQPDAPFGGWSTKGRFLHGAYGLKRSEDGPPPTLAWDVLAESPENRPFHLIDFGQYLPRTRFDAITQGIHDFYTRTAVVADLDGDDFADVATADGDPERGEINQLYFYKGLNEDLAFRWAGTSDEGHMLPHRNTILAYGGIARDLDDDGDMDIVVPGAPTALILINDGTGVFTEQTFADRPEGGLLPFTGYNPLFTPSVTEAVEAVDFRGNDGQLDMIIGGYAPYDSEGYAYASRGLKPTNLSREWHLPDDSGAYGHPWEAPLAADEIPVRVHTTFYLEFDPALGRYRDVTLGQDAQGQELFDPAGRREHVMDRMRAGDLDGDGDQDAVTGYRDFHLNNPNVEAPLPSGPVNNGNNAPNPADWQTVISLWINEDGRLVDEAARFDDPTLVPAAYDRLPEWTEPDEPDDFWNICETDQYESISIADFDSDGDLDIFLARKDTGSATMKQAFPLRNRLLINMGGAQKDHPGAMGGWKTGEFRPVADFGGPLSQWSGSLGAPIDDGSFAGESGAVDSVAVDLDRDGDMDLLLNGTIKTGVTSGPGHPVVWLENPGNAEFEARSLPGLKVDKFINGVTSDLSQGDGPGASSLAVAAGDFDHDGDYDVVTTGRLSFTPRYFENVGSAEQPNFVDRTALRNVSGFGEAIEDGITWTEQWTHDGLIVADFTGDGRHDLYIPNFVGVAQDELYISTPLSDQVAGVPALADSYPPTAAQVSGGEMILYGANLAEVIELQLRRPGAAEVQTVLPTSTEPKRLRFDMPPRAAMGVLEVVAISAQGASHPFTVTHLNAAPAVEVDQATLTDLELLITDADGRGDIDPESLSIVLLGEPNVDISGLAQVALASGGYQVVVSSDFALPPGTQIVVEVGDQLAAYTSARVVLE